jgi:hypothetical protein
VRVTGSAFEHEPYTTKLEGSGVVGHQSMAIAGIRDPEVLAEIDLWGQSLRDYVALKADEVLGLDDKACTIEVRLYGHNAVLGELDPDPRPPKEVGALLLVTADDQATATRVVKLANPYLLHMPLPGMVDLPSFAFMASPAEVERGPLYEFLLQHVVRVESPDELSRTTFEEVGA